jgi:hypothetical protein
LETVIVIDMSNISRYVQSLVKPMLVGETGNPACVAADAGDLAAVDVVTGLELLGTLFFRGEFKKIASLASQLRCSDIPLAERELLPVAVFTELYEIFRACGRLTPDFAQALLAVLVAIQPQVVLAHQIKPAGKAAPGVVTLAYAPEVRASVTGAIFFREFMSGPGSRKHEFGYRIQSALASQGWDISLYPLEELFRYSAPEIKDFVLIDVEVFTEITRPEYMGDLLAYVRRSFRKIIIIEPDPWAGLHDAALRGVVECIDYVWGFTSEWDILSEPCFRNKGILFPNVGGFDHLGHVKGVESRAATCTFNFTGSVQGYNVNRTFWILELLRCQKPVGINVTYPGIDDGLDHESSLQLYAQALAATQTSLNFITRKDGSRIITGRSIEIISLNRLLVQERCPAFGNYFADGEHFLEFETIDELVTCIDFLNTYPKVADDISSRGYHFYQERYSCRKLVEHIQTLL